MTASDSAPAGAEEQGVVVERVFGAPRELVWRAWTEAEHFKRWYGPNGMTGHTCEIDFRVGGRYLIGLRSPEGHDFWSTGTYREIVPLERFVATDSFSDQDGNVVSPTAFGMGDDVPMEKVNTITFEDLGDGKTRLTVHQLGWPEGMMAQGAGSNWEQGLDKLTAALADI
jgi:uncharacterized protein YndB with AHSA1/START domain